MKTKKNSYFCYYFFITIIKWAGFIFFGGRIINKEKIPCNEKVILAGNHVNNYDPYLICSSTKRPVHFIAKKELFSNPISKWFFTKMHLIPVDRSKKNPEAKKISLELLKEDKVIAIFPEGTWHKEKDLLPFKPGAVDYAKCSGSKIIPFAIIGNYHFRSNPKIVWGDPIDIGDMDIIAGTKYIEDVIRKLIKDNK